ncbi:hypothetical protein DAPPUDRAFT_252275 [Daphnia pulex]|uniref:Uncharacterized protein n=1 Tax=Daphnia pulex TaxID=6669 RepID=E9H2E1_DAPPU|nr:hypothetical protein DAPPUDRAFT_252275 [Daphnia pulex]|eukprot:EFX74160.1 hypothetical protein DAPPUDRAFT_252275 [Daphnia pulex]
MAHVHMSSWVTHLIVSPPSHGRKEKSSSPVSLGRPSSAKTWATFTEPRSSKFQPRSSSDSAPVAEIERLRINFCAFHGTGGLLNLDKIRSLQKCWKKSESSSSSSMDKRSKRTRSRSDQIFCSICGVGAGDGQCSGSNVVMMTGSGLKSAQRRRLPTSCKQTAMDPQGADMIE